MEVMTGYSKKIAPSVGARSLLCCTKIGGRYSRVNYIAINFLTFYMGKVVETHIFGSRIISQGQAFIVNIYSGRLHIVD